MTRRIDELESEVLQLEGRDRAALAKVLLDSLESLPEEEIEQLWAEEFQARYDDFRAGRTTAIEGDHVFAEARSRKR
jgi:putative addiction module component (TIGR02574 family)